MLTLSRPLRLLLALLTLATTAGADVLEVGVPIGAVPITLRRPGTYVLRRDLVYRGGTGAAITIAANGVTLDLGGHTITNLPASNANATTAVGVSAQNFTPITVRHGTLAAFDVGVSLTAGSGLGQLLVENVTTLGSGHTGISLGGSDSVVVQGCRSSHSGTVSATTNVWGILAGAEHVVIRDNEVYDTLGGITTRGIQVNGSVDNLIEHNVIANSVANAGAQGIVAFGGGSEGILVINNRVTNYGTGILFANGAPGKYRDNATASCTTPFSGGTSIGNNN